MARHGDAPRVRSDLPAPMLNAEFTVVDQHRTDRHGRLRWIWSHLRRQPLVLVGFLGGSAAMVVLNSMVPTLTGRGFDAVFQDGDDRAGALAAVTLALLAVVVARGLADLAARASSQTLARRLERDARDELYVSLLGKRQTFHDRQRVGDIMARAANDVRQLAQAINPGADLIVDSGLQGTVPLLFIATIDPRLLLVPLLYMAAFVVAIWHYLRQLNPVSTRLRADFGDLNAGLNEAVRGIEVIKVMAQEDKERRRFDRNATRYRDTFVRNGLIQARYLPPLLLAVALAGALWHALAMYSTGELTLGEVIAFMGLMAMLSVPTLVSVLAYTFVQLGLASAGRVLGVLNAESEPGHGPAGHTATMHGEIVFENVTFGYAGRAPVLRGVSFRARPGQTVAIVGETGAGKSTLTKLVPRIHTVDSGRVLVDGVDVRDWNLDSLRSQISTIEQDVVLFSRSVAENIAFGLGQQVDRESVKRAARDAQAEEFIAELDDGYETLIGERGVTLSGGQRQRLAIARAIITDPAILVLDDSTSAVDSATEDLIQQAIRRVLAGRTTLLITHRLSQIRWADQVLLLRQGELVDSGTHDELLARCPLYRRIFVRFDETEVPIGTGKPNGTAPRTVD